MKSESNSLYERALAALAGDLELRQFVRDLYGEANDLRAMNTTLTQNVRDLEASKTRLRRNLEDERRERRHAPPAPVNENDLLNRHLLKEDEAPKSEDVDELKAPTDPDAPSQSGVGLPAQPIKADTDPMAVDDLGVIDLTLSDDESNVTTLHAGDAKGKQPKLLGARRVLLGRTRPVSRNSTPGPRPMTVSGDSRRDDKRPADDDDNDEIVVYGPVKRPKVHSESTANQANLSQTGPRVAGGKLSVRRFVAMETRSIWDDACDLTLPALPYNGINYETGDVVVVRSAKKPQSLMPPDARVGVLCDWSTVHPFPAADHGDEFKIAHPRHTAGEVVLWVAVMWFWDPSDVRTAVNNAPDTASQDVEVSDEDRDLWTYDDKMKTLADKALSLPQNILFLSTEVHWVPVNELCGHVRPQDIGLAWKGSKRRVIIDWHQTVVTVREKWIEVQLEGVEGLHERLWYEYSLRKTSGLGKHAVPDGWLVEDTE